MDPNPLETTQNVSPCQWRSLVKAATISYMQPKELGKSVVGKTSGNPLAWALYRTCGRLSRFLGSIYGHAQLTRELGERDESVRKIAQELFPQLTVRTGPFQGMKYPSLQSCGSALLPKLLGSYESELHPFLQTLFANEYSTIIDIGCAEGYYAVGLGRRFPKAQIYAFDTDDRARALCAELGKLNEIGERLHIGGLCDEAVFRSIPLGGKALIISDCEGYERLLFTPEIAELLTPHDLIVETHDFINIEISPTLREVFAKTHQVQSINSVDDIEKAHTYEYPELRSYDTKTRQLILAERRPAIMKWLIMTPKIEAQLESQDANLKSQCV